MTKASRTSVPESTYRKHLLRAKDSGNYFTFFRLYTRIMTKLTGLFLQDLINLASMSRTKKTEIDGEEYFQCTVGFLENSGIGWTEKEQEYHLQELVKKGYVKRTKRGAPPTRWIYIDLEKIERDLDGLEDSNKENPDPPKKGGISSRESRSPGKGGDRSPGKQGLKKEDTSYLPERVKKHSRPGMAEEVNPSFSRNGHHSKNGQTPDHPRSAPPRSESGKGKGRSADPSGFDSFNRKCTVLLWEAVREKKPGEVHFLSSQKKWDVEFGKLRKAVSDDEILLLLKEHTEHWGEEYWPEAFCARSFRQKFPRIKSASARLKKSSACQFPTIKIGSVTHALVPMGGGGTQEVTLEELPAYLRSQRPKNWSGD